jgi:hypothetical protein
LRFNIHQPTDLDVYGTVEEIEGIMDRYGFSFHSKPGDEIPTNPVNIADMPPRELGEQLHRLTSFFDYASGKQAVVKILANNLKKSYDHAYSDVYMASKGTIEERKHKAELNPRVKEIKEKWLNAKSEADLLEAAVISPLKRDIATVSRLISVQEAEMQMSGRAHNVSRRTVDDALNRLKK